MIQIPVYLFTGFLEGGKTHIIQESMEDEKFNSGEKTLIIQCEEGEEEFNPTAFWGQNVRFKLIDNQEEFNKANLMKIGAEHIIERVIIECNGMWPMQTIYENLPDNWGIYQEMMFADANTFLSYNQNMRQQMVDKLLNAEMLVLNRTPDNIDKEEIHRVVRGISRRCAITYDYPDGHVEYDDIEDPLPYDLDAPVVTVKDEDYATFYRDLSEDMKKYDGKVLSFKGLVARDGQLGKKALLCGRHVMTCCEADIAYNPLVCIGSDDLTPKTRDWVQVTGKIKVEKHKLYRGVGPVLYLTDLKPTTKPTQEVATFY